MIDYIPLNFGLMSNPFNWINVMLMVAIGALALHLIFPTSGMTGNQEG